MRERSERIQWVQLPAEGHTARSDVTLRSSVGISGLPTKERAR